MLRKRKRPSLPLIHAEINCDRDIVAGCSETVVIEAAEGEGKKGPRKFDVTAYTGGPLEVKGYELPIYVDLKGMDRTRTLVANLDHEAKQRVGHVNEVQNDGK